MVGNYRPQLSPPPTIETHQMVGLSYGKQMKGGPPMADQIEKLTHRVNLLLQANEALKKENAALLARVGDKPTAKSKEKAPATEDKK